MYGSKKGKTFYSQQVKQVL